MTPSSQSVLQALSKARLVDLARDLGVPIEITTTKEQQVATMLDSGRIQFRELLRVLGRDELKAACRAHGLDDGGRARPQLAARLLEAHGALDTAPPPPLFSAGGAPRYAPRVGDIVLCRHRQWLVEDVTGPPLPSDRHTRVSLVCLDDDDPGRALEVFWELELGSGRGSRRPPPRARSTLRDRGANVSAAGVLTASWPSIDPRADLVVLALQIEGPDPTGEIIELNWQIMAAASSEGVGPLPLPAGTWFPPSTVRLANLIALTEEEWESYTDARANAHSAEWYLDYGGVGSWSLAPLDATFH